MYFRGPFADLLHPLGALKNASVQKSTQSAVVSSVGSEHKTALVDGCAAPLSAPCRGGTPAALISSAGLRKRGANEDGVVGDFLGQAALDGTDPIIEFFSRPFVQTLNTPNLAGTTR